eukprot:5647382-Amphidinium_carterae.2
MFFLNYCNKLDAPGKQNPLHRATLQEQTHHQAHGNAAFTEGAIGLSRVTECSLLFGGHSLDSFEVGCLKMPSLALSTGVPNHTESVLLLEKASRTISKINNCTPLHS